MDNDKELQKEFLQFLALSTGAKSEKELLDIILKLGKEGLEKAYQEFIKQKQQAVKAQYGAKLNYIRSLRGECPDGYKMKYFKKGGALTKKCMACGGKMNVADMSGTPVELFRKHRINK